MVCPNELVTLDCAASDTYDWSGSAFNCPDNPNPNNIRLSLLIIDSIVPTCGEFNVTGIEVTGSLITSQLQIPDWMEIQSPVLTLLMELY